MRKIIYTSIIVILISIFSISFAYTITNNDRNILNNINEKIYKIIDRDPLKYKISLIKQLEKINNKTIVWSRVNILIDEIIKYTKAYSLEDNANKHYSDYNLDINKLRNSWLSWQNEVRVNMWLPIYSYDSRLNDTAYEWSIISKNKWLMDHKRSPNDSFYDYKKIESWLKDRWVECKIKERATASESIWTFWYYCNSWDCTQAAKTSLRKIFDMYMSEKWKSRSDNPHYRAITSTAFSKIGLGLGVKEDKEFTKDYPWYRYYDFYVTTHYCTEFKN